MEQNPAPQSARSAIEYVCRLLRSYGVDSLTPELVRQAKFNSAMACRPLLQALHDLALCTAAGLPHGCAEGMRTLRQQIQQESIDADVLPAAGVLLLLHLLSHWGCPAGLVAQLSLMLNSVNRSSDSTSNSIGANPGSRVCLLCLAWLIGHAQLFDRAFQHLQIPGPLLQLLPPYPEDTSCTAAAQAKYRTAATAAQQHADAVQQLLKPQTPAASDGSCWQQVQVAAHHLLSTYRAASLRLQLLSSLLDGREKLLHEIKELQVSSVGPEEQQQGGRVSLSSKGRPVSMPSSSSSSKTLTAFELHLLSDPQHLQQHQQALQQGCSLLQQQLHCVQAAQTFFAWAASVLEEEQNQQQFAQASLTISGVAGTSGRMRGSTAVQGSRRAAHSSQQQSNIQQQQQQPWDVLSQPSVPDVLPLIQQLPPANTPVAAQVLMRITKQLQQAASAAGIATSSSSSNTGALGSTGATATAFAGLSLNSRIAGELQLGSRSSDAETANSFITAYVKTVAAAMVDGSVVPGPQAELLSLPDDIMQQLSKRHQQQADSETDEARQNCRQQLIWHRKQVTAEHLSMLTARPQLERHKQQQQQQQDASSVFALPVANEKDTASKADTHAIPVTAEVQRLHGLAVHVAKQLARVRATNKQQLQVASQLLGLTDAATAGSGSRNSSDAKLVMYKT